MAVKAYDENAQWSLDVQDFGNTNFHYMIYASFFVVLSVTFFGYFIAETIESLDPTVEADILLN